jgi:hypothetical protein
VVRHAAQARLLIAAGLLALGPTACGGGSEDAAKPVATATSTASAAANPDLGELRLVDCLRWRNGDEHARRGTVRELGEFASGPVGSPAGHGARLDDDVAYRFLDGYCAHSYATYFKLYKLYTRAAAFTPQR